jgi:putative spermidine/putrescine transport system permease protein
MSVTNTLDVKPPAPTPSEHEKASKRRRRLIVWGLLAPSLLALLVTYVFPLTWVLRMAFNIGQGNGIVIETFSFESIWTVVSDPYYWETIGTSLWLGVLVSVLCIVVSYPIALFLATSTSKWTGVLTVLAIAPLMTSAVVRTFGWMIILGNDGMINSLLQDFGFTSSPLPLANSFTGVTIGLVEIFMPYAILAMLSGFGRINAQLEDAAGSLGANRFNVFRRITFPLSLPGVFTALLLVFVLTIATFVTPRLLGGGRVQVMATEIYDQTTGLLNWPMAAALAVVLLILFGAVIAIYQRFTGKFVE